jgi:DNA-directed RNA polymerase I, II, and III subunit RPABC3
MSRILRRNSIKVTIISSYILNNYKVSRVSGQSENYEMELVLDINTDLYPIEIDTKLSFALASTLNLDGTAGESYYDQSNKETLADQYEYVMYGKVFQFYDEKAPSTKV